MIKKLKPILMVLAASFLFIGCGGKDTPQKEQKDGKVDRSQEIVIYSNSTDEKRGEWLKKKADENGFKISYVYVSGGQLADRLIAEKNNAVADMVFGLNVLEFNRIKKENLLQKYEPKWVKDVDTSLGDNEGFYYPLVVQPLVLIGNNKAEMPKDWIDLADDKYKDTYGIFALGGGTSKTVFASIVSRYKDENGDLGISKEGWDIAKKYIQNAHFYKKGEDYITAIMDDNNKLNYSMMFGSGLIDNQNTRKYKFNLMTPEVGVPFVTEQIGILTTTKKTALIKEFIDWFGSDKVQKEWSDTFGSIPVNKVALNNVNEDIKNFFNSVKPQKLDWEFIGKNISSWIEKAELEFVK